MKKKEIVIHIDEILLAIHNAKGQQCTIKDLTSSLSIAYEELTILLSEMESLHLIEHEEDAFFLTEKGYETVENGGLQIQTKEEKKQEAFTLNFGVQLMQQLEEMMADEPNQKENFKKIKRTTFTWLFGLALAAMFIAYLAKS